MEHACIHVVVQVEHEPFAVPVHVELQLEQVAVFAVPVHVELQLEHVTVFAVPVQVELQLEQTAVFAVPVHVELQLEQTVVFAVPVQVVLQLAQLVDVELFEHALLHPKGDESSISGSQLQKVLLIETKAKKGTA